MLKKNVRELSFAKGGKPMPTIEIQADSLDEQNLYLGKIVSDALSRFAEKNPATLATIYSFGTMSVNFHEAGWSEFLIVAGDKKVLLALGAAFSHYPGVKSRYSDYISPSDGQATYHVENGRLWQVEDAISWYSADPVAESTEHGKAGDADEDVEDEEDLLELDIEEDEDEEDDDSDADPITSARRTGRLNAARADAKISTIRRNIEKVFGLPEGSVALCGPDKTPMKGNALIKTLRRRWKES
jgi:hypothetical protein